MLLPLKMTSQPIGKVTLGDPRASPGIRGHPRSWERDPPVGGKPPAPRKPGSHQQAPRGRDACPVCGAGDPAWLGCSPQSQEGHPERHQLSPRPVPEPRDRRRPHMALGRRGRGGGRGLRARAELPRAASRALVVAAAEPRNRGTVEPCNRMLASSRSNVSCPRVHCSQQLSGQAGLGAEGEPGAQQWWETRWGTDSTTRQRAVVRPVPTAGAGKRSAGWQVLAWEQMGWVAEG